MVRLRAWTGWVAVLLSVTAVSEQADAKWPQGLGAASALAAQRDETQAIVREIVRLRAEEKRLERLGERSADLGVTVVQYGSTVMAGLSFMNLFLPVAPAFWIMTGATLAVGVGAVVTSFVADSRSRKRGAEADRLETELAKRIGFVEMMRLLHPDEVLAGSDVPRRAPTVPGGPAATTAENAGVGTQR